MLRPRVLRVAGNWHPGGISAELTLITALSLADGHLFCDRCKSKHTPLCKQRRPAEKKSGVPASEREFPPGWILCERAVYKPELIISCKMQHKNLPCIARRQDLAPILLWLPNVIVMVMKYVPRILIWRVDHFYFVEFHILLFSCKNGVY